VLIEVRISFFYILIFGLLWAIPSTRILSIFWLAIGFTVALVYSLYEHKKYKEYMKEYMKKQEEYVKGLNKVLNDYKPINVEIKNKLGIEYQTIVTFNNGESANIRFINGRNVQYAILPDIYNKSKYHSEIKEMVKELILKKLNE
jgi:hypothetical protein